MTENNLSILVAILGARMRYAVPVILSQRKLLAHFYTDYYYKNGSQSRIKGMIGYFQKSNHVLRMTHRHDYRLANRDVTDIPWLGLSYAAALRMARSTSQRDACYAYFSELFAKQIRKKDWFGGNAIYAINTAARETFELGLTRGATCLLEQINAPLRDTVKYRMEENGLFPGWQKVTSEKLHVLAEREEAEWRLADGILCGSEFVAKGLIDKGVAKEKCFVVPYTVDIDQFMPDAENQPPKGQDRLNILFVGRVDLLKGVQYLYEAAKQLSSKKISIRVVGNIALEQLAIKELSRFMQLEGPQPVTYLPGVYRWADILVLPSLYEGSALVTYEALASGLPVITTPNAGSVVQDGVNGFIVPIRDSNAIVERVQFLMDCPEKLVQLSKQARQTAENRLSWDAYSYRLIETCLAIHGRKNELN